MIEKAIIFAVVNRFVRTATLEKWLSILILFTCLFLLLEISYYAMFTATGHDGAYNLQVVDLLARGEGYASYGALRGDGKWLFDPHVTTGPAILVPLSVLWYITGNNIAVIHLAILSALWIYIAGLVFLFIKWSRDSSVLIGLAIGASLCITQIPVGELLGEMPAAAAIVWAAWAIRRNRPFILAILAGLSIQLKTIFGLAGITLLLVYIIWNSVKNNKIEITQVLILSFMFFLPTLLFELYRFVHLGNMESYLHSIEEYKWFTSLFSVDHVGTWFEPGIIGEKISMIYKTIPDMVWIACGISVLLIFFSFVFVLSRSESLHAEYVAVEESTRVALVGLMIAGLCILVTWMTQLKHSNYRIPSSFFLLFLPGFLAVGGYYHIQLREFCHRKKMFSCVLCLYAGIVLYSSLIILSLVDRIMAMPGEKSRIVELSVEQDLISKLILKEKPASLYVDGWHQNPNYLVLTRIQGVPAKTGRNQIMIVQDYQVQEMKKSFDEYSSECKEVLYRSDLTLVCRLPEIDSEESRLHVMDWGPRETRSGVIPGIQPDGNMGMWVKVRRVDRREVGPVKIYFSGYPSIHGHFSDGEVVTAAFPPRRIRESGNYEVTIKQMATGDVYHVGYFVVD